MEAPIKLVLPLLGEAAGADDEAALQVAAGDQLLDQQPRHDGLAGARIVRQQEAQRLARQHALVDGCDLVRQRLDDRGVDGEHGIEQMGEMDALRFRHEAEQVRRRRRSSKGALASTTSRAARRRGRAARCRLCRSASL